METIESLKRKPSAPGSPTKPYPKSLRCRVVGMKEDPGRNVIEVALADKTDVIKGMCYNKALKPKLKGTILIRNFTRGRYGLLLKDSTVVHGSYEMEITDQMRMRAENILSPGTVQLKDVTEDIKDLITVEVEIVKDEIPHTTENGSLVRNMHVKEGETEMPVTLWNQLTSSPVKNGDRAKITHLRVVQDNYLKELALRGTPNTKIEVVTAPMIQIRGHVIAAEQEGLFDQFKITIEATEGALREVTASAQTLQVDTVDAIFQKYSCQVGEKAYIFDIEGPNLKAVRIYNPEQDRKAVDMLN